MANLEGYKNWSKAIKELTNTGIPQVEISLAFNDNEDFEHEGYYNNIDEAIEALKKLKEYYRQIVEPRCNICVYNPLECNGNDNYHCCPHYKRAMSASYPLHDLGAL